MQQEPEKYVSSIKHFQRAFFPHLRVAQEIVERQQHTEDEARLAVKEPSTKNVMITETNECTARQMSVDTFELPLDTPTERHRLHALIQFTGHELVVEFRLPARITVVLLDPAVDGRIGVMFDARLETTADLAVENDMLMRLAVADVLRSVRRHLLVASELMTKEPQHAQARIPAMMNRPAEEHVEKMQIIAVRIGVRNLRGNLLRQFRRNHLIRINDQHPLVADRKVLQRPVLLLRIASVEVELNALTVRVES